MATPAQIIANTANAQHSTGPTTPEGKARSSANAIRLGFNAQQAVLLTPDDHQAFDALSWAFYLELHPTGPIEVALQGQIVLAAWNIERANKLEVAMAASGIDPLLSDENEKLLSRIATYRMRAERTFHKCLKELQTYQAAHPIDEIPFQNEPKSAAKSEMQNEPKLPPRPLSEYKFNRQPYVCPTPKVGRNDMCPCKSGRKYKQCCLQKEANLKMKSIAA